MEHAYSLINVNEFSTEQDMFTVKGIASTPTTNRMNQIVDPMGARFETPMPLLWQHNPEKPIGHMNFAKPSKDGIPFEASIPIVKEEGTVKDRIDEAIHSLKYKLVTAVSIGFNPIEDGYEILKNGIVKFNLWEWMELSLVTIPANPEARINLAMSIDQKFLAAHGRKGYDYDQYRTLPGVTGKRRPIQLIPRKTS